MQALNLKSTDSTPEIVFDPATNHFEIIGESRPENVKAYYEPVIDWVKKYVENFTSGNKIIIKVKLDYFSSSSAKYIMNILARFEEVTQKQGNVEVYWFYHPEDQMIKEAGEEFEKILNVTFKYFEA